MKLDYGDITTKQRLLINSALYNSFQQTIYKNGVSQWNFNPSVSVLDLDLYNVVTDEDNKPHYIFNENFNGWFEDIYESSLTQELIDKTKLELGMI